MRLSRVLISAAVGWCVVIGILWLRSVRHEDELSYETATRDGVVWWLNSYGGKIQFLCGPDRNPDTVISHLRLTTDAIIGPEKWDPWRVEYKGLAGVGIGETAMWHFNPYAPYSGEGPLPYAEVHLYCIRLPHWMLILPAASFVGVRVYRRARRRQLLRDGRCSRCGYDMRATPNICPECGQIVTARPTITDLGTPLSS